MRIDFYHIDLLKDTLKLQKVKVIDTESNTATHYSQNMKSKDVNKDSFNLSKDYLDIKGALDTDNSEDSKEFVSEDTLSSLKNSISSDDYNINSKALAMSLIKYIERS